MNVELSRLERNSFTCKESLSFRAILVPFLAMGDPVPVPYANRYFSYSIHYENSISKVSPSLRTFLGTLLVKLLRLCNLLRLEVLVSSQ